MVLKAQVRSCELRCHEKKNNKISPTPLTSKSQVRTCGINFGKIKMFVFTVPKPYVRTCELHGHEKEKDFSNRLAIEVTGPDNGINFGKIKIFVFKGLKAQVRTGELHGHKKKKRFPQFPRHQSHRSEPLALILENSKFFLWP